MESIKRKLTKCFTFLFLLLVSQSVAVFFASDSKAAAGAWYLPGKWITRATIPNDIAFPELNPPLGGSNQLAVIKTIGQDGDPIRYISGFFSPPNRLGFKAIADALIGLDGFTSERLASVRSVRERPSEVDLGTAKIAVTHFVAAVDHMINLINTIVAPEIQAAAMPVVTDASQAANKGQLQTILFVSSRREFETHSERALLIDILKGEYPTDSRIIVKSKLDMCSKCETGLNPVSTDRHAARADAIPYEIYVGASQEYTNDPHPNGVQNAKTRTAPRHGDESCLFKTALEQAESHEAVAFPAPPQAVEEEDRGEGPIIVPHHMASCRDVV
ncbi:MAG: hypothetical protein Q4B70_15390 [Lachnospiraceae bacterium]|nr:hypothetical protein [Lachnospiraceae bacterium]